MKTILLSAVTFLLSLNFNIYSQWKSANGNLIFSQALNLTALDSSNAVISTSAGGLYKTTDGGSFWSSMNSPLESVIALSAVDASNIWIASSSSIYKTSDAGNSWVEQFNNESETDFFNYLKMFDLNAGIAMGDAKSSLQPALFLKTTDGGDSWISVNSSDFIGQYSSDTWRRICFTDSDHGYFFPGPYTGGQYKNLYKTTDGGFSWNLTNYNDYAWVISFYDRNIGIISPAAYKINRTLDGGQSWETFNSGNQSWALDIRFDPNDASRVWLLADDLFFSSDTGRTWIKELADADGYVMSVVDSRIAWISGGGKIYRTSSAGDSFVTVETEDNSIVDNFELKQNYPNPFNPLTKISWQSPVGGHQTLKVFDVLGREVATLVDEYKEAGRYEVEFQSTVHSLQSAVGSRHSANRPGSALTSGVYFYQLIISSLQSKVGKAGESANGTIFVETKKMIFVK